MNANCPLRNYMQRFAQNPRKVTASQRPQPIRVNFRAAYGSAMCIGTKQLLSERCRSAVDRRHRRNEF